MWPLRRKTPPPRSQARAQPSKRPGAARPSDQLPDMVVANDFTGNPDQPYRKTAAAMAILNVGQLLVICLLTSALVLSLIYRKTDVVFVQWAEGSDRWVRLSTPGSTRNGADYIARRSAMQYVILRESIVADPDEMRRRWGTSRNANGSDMQLFNTQPVDNAFRGARSYWDLLERFQRDAMVRTIPDKQITVSRISRNQIRVEYYTEDKSLDGTLIERKHWQAYVTNGYRDLSVDTERAIINPDGYVVTYYTRDELK